MTRTFTAPSSRLAQTLGRPFSHGWRREVLIRPPQDNGSFLRPCVPPGAQGRSGGVRGAESPPSPGKGRGNASRAAREETLRTGGRGSTRGWKSPGGPVIRWGDRKARAGLANRIDISSHGKGSEDMKKNAGNRILGTSLAVLLVLRARCATNPDGTKEYKRTAIGALAGGAGGAVAGALIGGT